MGYEGGRGWLKGEGNVWSAKVPEVAAGEWFFEQLWEGGRRAVRARTPNVGFFHVEDGPMARVRKSGEKAGFQGFQASPEEFALFQAIPEAERAGVLVTMAQKWSVSLCRVRGLHEAGRTVEVAPVTRYDVGRAGQRYFVENYRGALDAAGEWYLDRRAGVISYVAREGEDLTKLPVVAPVSQGLLRVKGAHDLRFRGIAFRHGNDVFGEDGHYDMQAAGFIGGAVEVEDTRGFVMEDCEVGQVGRYGVFFKNGCAEGALRRCHLHDLGAGGVRIGELARPGFERLNRGIVVEDCIIQHGGRLHASACGVLLTHAEGCAVRHNDIGDFYYTGVSFGWNWGYGESVNRDNVLEWNHIHHLGWGYLSDMGGFYNLGSAPGTVVRGNHVHHVASYSYGGWGLYTDEGSTNVLFEKNLVHDTTEAGFHQHYGFHNVVRNNIFAFGRNAQIQRSRAETHLSFVYERNLVLWDAESPLLYGTARNWKFAENRRGGDPRDQVAMRRNLYWRTDGKKPEKLAGEWSWEEWQKMGRDAGSVWVDPLFVDVARRDFRLQEGSPARKMGFEPWDHGKAGVRGEAWRKKAAEGWSYPEWAERSRPWPKPHFAVKGEDFESLPVGALGIRGVSYAPEGKGDAIAVVEGPSSPLAGAQGKKSLQIQDAEGLKQTYHPLLNVRPDWGAGTVRVSFDVMAEEGAHWFFEIRGGAEFGAGPMVSWRGGKLIAGHGGRERVMGELPAGKWVRVEIAARTGSGKWSVTMTGEDGKARELRDLPTGQGWEDAGYFFWSGTANAKTAFYLDELSLEFEAE
ncbi:MAG: right-handed parallel beta-helix repeat-containing protein [Verrucomicrobiales bacterium]